MNSVCFVILHYENVGDTIECIESILSNPSCKDSNIVVVDNCSKNKSGHELKKKYQNNSKIQVIINEKNEGFARGNNIGYRYALQNGTDFIVMINNDTKVQDSNFCKTFCTIYQEQHYAVLGPDVYSIKDNRHQNPLPGVLLNKKMLQKKLQLILLEWYYAVLIWTLFVKKLRVTLKDLGRILM